MQKQAAGIKTIKLLKKHNAWCKFIKNSELPVQRIISRILRDTSNSMVGGLFSWRGSPEGWDYWHDLRVLAEGFYIGGLNDQDSSY